jgi:hypothetical protein
LGKTHTLETRRLMSETRRGPNNPMFGKSPSALLGVPMPLQGGPVRRTYAATG